MVFIVDIALKPEILDRQRHAIVRVHGIADLSSFSDLRQGKEFVLTVQVRP